MTMTPREVAASRLRDYLRQRPLVSSRERRTSTFAESEAASTEWLTRTGSAGARHFLTDGLVSTLALADGSSPPIEERCRRQRWAHDAAIGSQRAFPLFQRLRRDVPCLLGIPQRLHGIVIHGHDVGHEVGGLAMERDDVLEVGHVHEPVAICEQLLPDASQLVLDRDERGHHAVAVVDRGLHVGDRADLAGPALIDRDGLQPMEQHELRVESSSILLDQGSELSRRHQVTVLPCQRCLGRLGGDLCPGVT